ncbi:molybdopterin-dependent oxidoreductase [Rhodobacterales bacterium HKCCE2091]|nr:molybdopterin-dependent oxidoreductase [Rhodobacterales bacterium HKCCE2091]
MTGERRTTCPYCGVGCGVVAARDVAGALTLRGDRAHPANAGRLCSKGSALGETIDLDDRLLAPTVGGTATDWDTALDLVARKLRDTIAAHGPDSVGFYVSGQLLTEDYYVANKLMKGFIGSANIDTNSRLCMASSVAGHRRAFGTDTVPGSYEDLELADLVVLVGSNLAWCHPVLFQRLAAARAARPEMRVVTIDPRRTATSELADLHLALRPGSDVALFNALLVRLYEQGAIDKGYLAHVDGFDEALRAAYADDPDATGLDPADLHDFVDLWTRTERVVTVYSQGVNQSATGTDKVNAILNCHLASGRIGKPGAGPFSVTGQPNAMGGREVGGLANMLACHMELENAAHRSAVREFWDAPAAPSVPGKKAVEMFEAVGRGEIRALWIIHTNPAVSMPDADRVRDAIAGCEFVVVSDITARTDTARLAHVVLPAAAWGEKDGTVTNSERVISRQRTFLKVPGKVRPDWEIIAGVGRRMGWTAAFDYAGPAEIFREYATLSGIAGRFGLDFDISGLAGLSDAEYDALAPVQWPVTTARTGGRFFGDGRFFTATGRGRMLPLRAAAPKAVPDAAYPLLMNTGRVRDHWHTMTRTAKSPRLSAHLAEPYLEVNPADAERLGLAPAAIAEVESAIGRALLRVRITTAVAPGQVFAPMHWTAETASAGRIDALVAAVTDPVSGQPESKATAVRVSPLAVTRYGFLLSRDEPRPGTAYWARARIRGGWQAELAWTETPADLEAELRAICGLPEGAGAIELRDAGRGLHRVLMVDGDEVLAALFTAPEPVALARSWLRSAYAGSTAAGLMAGRPGADRPDPGATVCACFDVGVNTIRAAILDRNLASVAEIGAALQAGTNCGSCRPELQALLDATHPSLAAE